MSDHQLEIIIQNALLDASPIIKAIIIEEEWAKLIQRIRNDK